MSPRLRLVLLSFLILFVELALIRWIESKVVYLSYFSNFILLGSFLGVGIGFLRGDAKRNLFPWAPITLALLIGFVTVRRAIAVEPLPCRAARPSHPDRAPATRWASVPPGGVAGRDHVGIPPPAAYRP